GGRARCGSRGEKGYDRGRYPVDPRSSSTRSMGTAAAADGAARSLATGSGALLGSQVWAAHDAKRHWLGGEAERGRAAQVRRPPDAPRRAPMPHFIADDR
ncbi:unnamed protein product, partial [Urochloa humidicola]